MFVIGTEAAGMPLWSNGKSLWLVDRWIFLLQLVCAPIASTAPAPTHTSTIIKWEILQFLAGGRNLV